MVRPLVQSMLLQMLQYRDWLGVQVRAFQHVHGEARGPLGPETKCVTSTRPARPRQDKMMLKGDRRAGICFGNGSTVKRCNSLGQMR